MDLDEALALAKPYAETEDSTIIVDGEARTITIPDSETLFGVKGDKDVERKYFRCPKVVGDNIDLSKHQIYISYVFTKAQSQTSFPDVGDGLYHCEDVEVSGDDITFSWLLSGNVFANSGFVAFKILAKYSDGEILKTKWNTTPAYGAILMTVPDGETIAEHYPDVINQLFDRLDALEVGGVSDEKISQAVSDYLDENLSISKLEETDTNYTVEAKIDPETGKLYVPSISFSTTENPAGGLTVNIG